MSIHYSSKSNNWATPQPLFDKLSEIFGEFTLDPCATPANAKCSRFFTEEDDGLAQSWNEEMVFMNPPYGREISKWIQKAYQESFKGADVVCLIPARTDTSWWHDFVMHASKIILLRGRVRFEGGKNSAPFPSAVVEFCPRLFTGLPKLMTLDVRKLR